ncbi:hypothetical protein BDQ12DRAFT_442036 [Crucibulum laeve]|uniref:Ubinuclein middle domain-containing protein n=1 Tax=Crucibulum laeve TaxID=68775 RepID=A0A5C3LL16_9AGAR|nr:hypothetical protein BDQ12DRAFT_442036 [Crucibulum laeve]
MKDKTPKKPKSKKHSVSHPPLGSTIKQEGTRETPIAVSDSEEQRIKHASAKAAAAGVAKAEDGEGGERAGQKRKRYITVVEGGKKRKVVDVNSFHPELQESIEEMKKTIAEESWAQKGKFPPGLKPMLAKLALKAVQLDEYDEHFFNLMPTLFPYNKFTMTKLIKRTIFQEHTALLMERQDALLRELKQLADEGFPKAEEEWEKAVVAWDKRQEKARAESGVAGGAPESISAAPTRHPTEEMEVEHASHAPGADGHDGDEGKDGKRDLHPPGKRFRMTEQMKSIVWQLVLLSNECCRLENEKNTLEGSIIQVSEQGGRKVLYQKIVAAFPEGWMSSGQISRDVSAMKKKFEKEAMEDGA